MEKRRLDLEKWLGALVWRCDVLGSKDFQNFSNVISIFTQLRKMIDPKWLTTPRPSLKLQTGHLFPVVDFYYEPET